jgi:hypothetical protein
MSDLTFGEQTNWNNLTDHHMSGDELVFFVNGKKVRFATILSKST